MSAEVNSKNCAEPHFASNDSHRHLDIEILRVHIWKESKEKRIYQNSYSGQAKRQRVID